MGNNKPDSEKHPCIIYYLTLCATLGGFLFGYDTGIINGALILIDIEYDISDNDAERIVASTVFAAAIFSLFSGIVADAIGRKLTIMLSAAIFMGGGVCMGFAPGVMWILVGRLIVGSAIGFVSSVIPIYISECSPNSIRGLLITMNQLFITFGIVISALFGGIFQNIENGWRYMLGLSVIPALIQFVLFLGLPESPRYLIMNGNDAKAEATLKQIRKKSDVSEELSEMKRSLEEEQGSKGWAIWKRIMTTPHIRRALFVGCMLQMFQQFSGINAVIYYSSTILKAAGFSSKLAIWLAVVPATINFLATFIGLWAVESLGRKLVLALSFLSIGMALLVLSAGFFLSQYNSPQVSPSNEKELYTSPCNAHKLCHECVRSDLCGFCFEGSMDHVNLGSCVNISKSNDHYAAYGRCSQSYGKDEYVNPTANLTYGYCPTSFGWLAVLGMMLFVLGFAPGAGPMPWTINAEIYPQWGRSIANSLATVANWTCNVILSAFFLTLINTITAWGTFLLFCGVCLSGAVFVLMYVPETKDKSLEEIELLFMTEKVRNETLESRQRKEEVEEIAPVSQITDILQRASTIQPSFGPGRTGSISLT